MPDIEPLIRIRGLTKSFGGTRALDSVSLTVMPHEVHGLLGENGSGKSTLIKVLAGFHEPDTGVMEVGGQPVELPLRPGQYRELGFEFVHQDLGLIPTLSVTENLFLGDIAASRAPFYSWRAANSRAEKIFSRHGVNIDPTKLVELIRPVDCAMLAIIRAVEGLRTIRQHDDIDHPNLLVLDEPTVFLPQHEVAVLFDFVRSIAAGGSSVLFVSHDLDEVLEITDRVTVLRDGRTSGTAVTSNVTKQELIHLIIGHELAESQTSVPAVREGNRPAVLRVSELNTGALRDVSFDLLAGEVLGFAGLVGSGYEDIVYAVYGADQRATGTMTVPDRRPIDLQKHDPRAAVELGMALVPADRKNAGSIATLSAADNINLTVLDRHFRGFRLRRGKLRDNAYELMREFDVRPPLPDLDYGSFSGGNQQKAMMAKWQQLAPKVLLLHEPTQGVDIGAREQIYGMIRNSTDTTATICASSDYEQLATICDRVGIIVRGRLITFVAGEALNKSTIANLCLGRPLDSDSATTSTGPAHPAIT